MQELIKVTTTERGSQVVSARDLHTFLQIKKQFADWIKHRIEKYGLVEGVDFTTFSPDSEKGRPTIEYALTLSAAKELAMVEGNEKGKQARLYFIACEEKLRQVGLQPAPSTAEVLLQQAHALVDQQKQLNELRAVINSIQENVVVASPARSLTKPVRPQSLRQAINRKVSEYCGRFGVDQQESWNYLYKRLFQIYRIDIWRLARKHGESYLEAAERYGFMEKLYAIVSAELDYIDE